MFPSVFRKSKVIRGSDTFCLRENFMDYTPVTPFRRARSGAVIENYRTDDRDLPAEGVNKWDVLRELAAARTRYELSDRDVTVLQALISFHPTPLLGGQENGDLIVYPSNKTICQRLNGMPCSTMRRHLANLVAAGFLQRRDSPNGKRYARTYGGQKLAFGFDLSPLVHRFEEICKAANAIRTEQERHARLRTAVSLMRRDLAALAEYGATRQPGLGLWDELSDLATLTARRLRCKLSLDDLTAIRMNLKAGIDAAANIIDSGKTKNLSTTDTQYEQHPQNSNIELNDNEEAAKKTNIGTLPSDTHMGSKEINSDPPIVPLACVLDACREFRLYEPNPVRHWNDLVAAASRLRAMLGITAQTWDRAQREMGTGQAAVTLMCILERFTEIRSPGAYLQALSAKAAVGKFSCGPMVMSLMQRNAA